jgi:hypothetical protein
MTNDKFFFRKMSSDSEEENWHETYPKTVNLLLTPAGQTGVMFSITSGTRLPYPYRFEN